MSATSSRFTGPDGREYVSINLATHRVFARACLDEWTAREGVARHWLLAAKAKAVSVPADMLEGARARLSKAEQESAQ